ncbi:MAG: nucleoside kinase [Tissierellia bacterium]|nr:nucleoside kinase [Tissierellia bacterium]
MKFKVDKKYDGKTIYDIVKIEEPNKYQNYLGAIVKNTVYNLNEIVYEGDDVELLSSRSKDGYKILTRTMTLILALALKRINSDYLLEVEHFIGGGLYVEFSNGPEVNNEFVNELTSVMRDIIKEDIPINRKHTDKLTALKLFAAEGYIEKEALLETLDIDEVDMYFVDDYIFSFHGYLAPSTGFGKDFFLKLYYPGVVMMFPSPKSGDNIPTFYEERSLAKVFSSSKKWTDMLGIGYVANLNRTIIEGDYEYLIEVSEAYFENKISKAADLIVSDEEVKFILIAGPSSSGKTTTAHRLAVQMAVRGKRPFSISIDDYFLERDKTPRNANGEYDFETIRAVDIDYFNRDLLALLDGKTIQLPRYNFNTGKREMSDNFIFTDSDHPIIIEGIHALNPTLTYDVPDKNKFKVYISALTQLNLDKHNRISATDVRLLRRIVRDNNFRGYSVEETFDLWKNVLKGEEKWIFPFQDEADFHLDSALIYEIAILKKHAINLFDKIDDSYECYKDVKRLQRFLYYFRTIDDDNVVPLNSILREFIGKIDSK